MKNIFKTNNRGIIAILTLCILLNTIGICAYATTMPEENSAVTEDTTVVVEETVVATEEPIIVTEENIVVTEENAQELMPMMARGCDEEDSYPLTNGYYGDPGISGGNMRVMGGGYSAACAFFTYLTNCQSVVDVTTPIPGGGTARITRSNSAASGYAIQIQTSVGQPFKSQRIHFN